MKVLSVVIILLYLCSAVIVAGGGESITVSALETLTQTVDNSGSHGFNLYSVLFGFFSIWLIIIGLMCQSLENIPGIKPVSKEARKQRVEV